MAGLIGLFGGNSAKTDRKDELRTYGELDNVFNQSMAQNKESSTMGANDTGAGASFFKNVLGNRTAATQAVAPEVANATSANDATKRQLANSGTARGGGATAFNQTRDQNTQGQIDQLLFGARSNAAGEEAKIGQGETTAGIEDMFSGEKAAAQHGELASQNRSASQGIHNSAVSGAVSGVGDILSLAMPFMMGGGAQEGVDALGGGGGSSGG